MAERKEWKGLTWGMLPLHTSGLIACTYHVFYNAPKLVNLVAMQVRSSVYLHDNVASFEGVIVFPRPLN